MKIPSGEWKVKQIVDADGVILGKCDKPCFKITGPEGLEGFYWGWDRPRTALCKFVNELYGVYPSVINSETYLT